MTGDKFQVFYCIAGRTVPHPLGPWDTWQDAKAMRNSSYFDFPDVQSWLDHAQQSVARTRAREIWRDVETQQTRNAKGRSNMTATHRTVRLVHLDGRPFAEAGFPCDVRDPGAPWAWIQELVAHEQDCHEDDVGCEESEDGDAVTVRGEAVYFVKIGVDNFH